MSTVRLKRFIPVVFLATLICILYTLNYILLADVRCRDTKAQHEWRLYADLESGQLGNKLFNLAGTYGLARTNHRTLVFTQRLCKGIRLFLNLSHLNVECSDPDERVLHQRVRYAVYQHAMENLPEFDLVVGRFVQSFRYFQPYEHDLRKQSVINNKLVSSAQRFLHDLHVPVKSTFIGLHVRHMNLNDQTLGRRQAKPEYLRRAMSYFLHKYNDVQFIVSTDDLDHCKTKETYLTPGKLSHIADYGIHYSSLKSPQQDLALLAQCNHSIMTVGTFGWWGSWLAGGEVIYYNQSIWKHSKLDTDFRSEDFFWPSWIGMGDNIVTE